MFLERFFFCLVAVPWTQQNSVWDLETGPASAVFKAELEKIRQVSASVKIYSELVFWIFLHNS